MTDSKISRRGPGRPRGFDDATVLGAAMRLFWRDGYSGASMPEISAATGLSTSSLYNAYGSKLDLLVAALDHYSDTVLDSFMLGPLAGGAEGLADIDAFLDRLGAAVDVTHPWGCLTVNTIAEFRDPPPAVAARTARYRSQLRQALHAALSRAHGLGEVPADAVDRRADALVPIVVAFNLLVAAQAPASETHDLLAAARSLTHRGLP
ncbi:MAG TPA: TetR/AcrR family transcriptional regulator [Pseudonocardia sp.]|jgi:TetR/AcrR family transcriptional repressor of nem operon|uniref:TetR/AcrR family transcriptional regulator n=1 Tax=Pseudonocardia sp. TaxID=60912 RepID=UPI002B9CD89A|nr:TetR/AcrR family transcriptional regulator [Pseudonocardia sp.]HTF54985.1 TetR/AcrR family transcriptional regulator [Pseudonocardia sp.]